MSPERKVKGPGTILIALLILAIIAVLPMWGYNSSWGYAPVELIAVLLIIVLIIALMGRLR